MGDFFAFRRMLAPLLIHIIFWVGVLATLGIGILMILDKMDLIWDHLSLPALQSIWTELDKDKASHTKMLCGLILAIGGPFFFRLYCELVMLPFRINGTLTEIRTLLKAQEDGTGPAPRRI